MTHSVTHCKQEHAGLKHPATAFFKQKQAEIAGNWREEKPENGADKHRLGCQDGKSVAEMLASLFRPSPGIRSPGSPPSYFIVGSPVLGLFAF